MLKIRVLTFSDYRRGLTRGISGMYIPRQKKMQFIAFINVFTLIIPKTKYSVKRFLAISHSKKWLHPRLDYSTILQLRIFLEILDNYWCYQLKNSSHFSTNSIRTLNNFVSLSYTAKWIYQQSISIVKGLNKQHFVNQVNHFSWISYTRQHPSFMIAAFVNLSHVTKKALNVKETM